tara:strand:- start:2075 stop:2539 length:465 start_codon:yes stop_codon:yes gene_type:complete
MPTVNGVYNGSSMLLFLDAEILVHSTNVSVSINTSLKDTTSRETDAWNTSLPGLRNWGATADAAIAFTTTSGTPYTSEPFYTSVNEILNDYILNRNPVFIEIMPPMPYANNNFRILGEAYITSASIDTPLEDSATWNLTLTGKNHIIADLISFA